MSDRTKLVDLFESFPYVFRYYDIEENESLFASASNMLFMQKKKKIRDYLMPLRDPETRDSALRSIRDLLVTDSYKDKPYLLKPRKTNYAKALEQVLAYKGLPRQQVRESFFQERYLSAKKLGARSEGRFSIRGGFLG